MRGLNSSLIKKILKFFTQKIQFWPIPIQWVNLDMLDASAVISTSVFRGCHINPGKMIKNNKLLIRRDKLDLKYMLYFISNNIMKKDFNNNFSPYIK